MRKNDSDCDVYIYHKQFMIEKPSETKLVNRYYDESAGWVGVLKHKTLFTEFICILILVMNVIVLLYYPRLNVKVYIPEYFNLYDGNLYTNIVSDENNKVDISCTIMNQEYVLSPGDKVYVIHTDLLPQNIDVTVTYRVLLFKKSQSYVVPVHSVY